MIAATRDLLVATGRSLRSLRDPRTFWHMVWPALAATALWLVVAWVSWQVVVDAAMGTLASQSWLAARFAESGGAETAALFFVEFALLFALLPLIYVTSIVLVSVVAIPLMLERVGRTEYADVEMRRGGTNLGSAWNSAKAATVFVLALVVSLPLWLIPGAGLVISLLLTAWLNQRAFGYDALMLHADRAELAALPRALKPRMLVLGSGCALLAHVPFVNLLAPAFSGLAFVHFMLEALRASRKGADTAVAGRVRPYSGVS